MRLRNVFAFAAALVAIAAMVRPADAG